jgi:GNAT superfamily N-acetyltransferase
VGQIDLAHDAMFGVFNRDLRLVAIAHLAFATGGRTAEFGVSVLERWRARGIGARLFKHAVMHARNRGAASLVIYMARHNAAMIGIVRRWGARISFEGAEGTAELPLRTDTMRSRIEQLLEQHAAEMDYRFKQQALRRDRVLRT